METKNKVRKRRMERIRSLQEYTDRRPYPLTFDSGNPYPVQDKKPSETFRAGTGPGEMFGGSERLNDPEYAWKQRWLSELEDDPYESDRRHGSGKRWGPSKRSFQWKLLASCLIFALVYLMFQWNHPLANQGKAFLSSALQDSFDFRPVALWYERQFGGSPSLLPALNPVKQQEAEKVTAESKHYFPPVKGKVIAPFETSRLGVTLETKADAAVAAIDTGLVVYVGSKEDTGYTVILRHTNGLQSVYGWIGQGQVQENDWIKGGETIGTVSKNSANQSGYLYFAISKDNKFVNPTDVVGFD